MNKKFFQTKFGQLKRKFNSYQFCILSFKHMSSGSEDMVHFELAWADVSELGNSLIKMYKLWIYCLESNL